MGKRLKPPRKRLRVISNGAQISHQARTIHTKVEADLAKAKLPPTSCQKGCDHCCYKLVVIGLPDALMIAQAIMEKPNWKRIIPRLRESALHACNGEVREAPWFEKHIPCPLLDTENKVCTIYQSRPTPCRYHMAVSPAELCDPQANPGAEIALIDLRYVERAIDAWQMKVAIDLAGIPFAAALPVMVLYAMTVFTKDTDVKKALEGLTDPRDWHLRHRNVGEEVARAIIAHSGGNPDDPDLIRRTADQLSRPQGRGIHPQDANGPGSEHA